MPAIAARLESQDEPLPIRARYRAEMQLSTMICIFGTVDTEALSPIRLDVRHQFELVAPRPLLRRALVRYSSTQRRNFDYPPGTFQPDSASSDSAESTRC
jgi:hypothetical protein